MCIKKNVNNDVCENIAEEGNDSKKVTSAVQDPFVSSDSHSSCNRDEMQSLDINMVSGDFVIPEVSKDYISSEFDVPTLEQNMGIVEPKESIYAGKDVYLSIEGGQVVFYRGTYVTRIPLRGESLLFGRRDVMAGHYPDVDLAMYWKQDCSISRRHLRIYADVNGAYYVEDICGHNATYVNSYTRPLNRERLELKPGDRIFVSKSIAVVFCVR